MPKFTQCRYLDSNLSFCWYFQLLGLVFEGKIDVSILKQFSSKVLVWDFDCINCPFDWTYPGENYTGNMYS